MAEGELRDVQKCQRRCWYETWAKLVGSAKIHEICQINAKELVADIEKLRAENKGEKIMQQNIFLI